MMTREELQQVREDARRQIEAYDCRILVCSGTGCIATGSTKIYEEFLELVKNTPGIVLDFAPHDEDGEHVGVKKTGCQGFCELGPLVRIQRGDEVIQYVKVQPEDCREIFEETVVRGEIVDHLLYTKKDVHYKHPEDIPFMAKQTRIVLENCGRVDAESLDEYIASGGFEALNKAMFEMSRDEVIDEVDRSGLRGRGGGGFPCGRKWKQVARQKETVRYVVCNGDEGDPGAFMDGSVMEGDPFKLIEGMMIAAYAVKAADGYIYVRAEYPMSVARLRHAIAQLEEICGRPFDYDKFFKVQEQTQRSVAAWNRVAAYAQNKPSPLNGFDLFNYMGLIVCARSLPYSEITFNKFCDELEAKKQAGKSAFGDAQKRRK